MELPVGLFTATGASFETGFSCNGADQAVRQDVMRIQQMISFFIIGLLVLHHNCVVLALVPPVHVFG